MAAAPRPKPIREVVKLLLVHLGQDRRQRPLHQLVLRRGNTERAQPAVPFRYPPPSTRMWAVLSSMQAVQQRPQSRFQSPPVFLHVDPVHPRGLPFLQSLERPQQKFRVQVAEQVVEAVRPMRPSSSSDAFQAKLHRVPVPEYGRCFTGSLRWRRRLPSTRVTRLHRYYAAIRLPPRLLPSSPLQLVQAYSRGERRGSPWLPPRHPVQREPASDPGRPRDTRHSRGAGCCLQRCRALGRDPTGTTFRGSIPSRGGCRPPPLVLASLSCLRINLPVAVQAARLDTGPVASRYPGGLSPPCRGDLARSLPASHCWTAHAKIYARRRGRAFSNASCAGIELDSSRAIGRYPWRACTTASDVYCFPDSEHQ